MSVKERFSYFASHVYRFNLADSDATNVDVLDRVYSVKASDPVGISKSNQGVHSGWHSGTSIHQEPAFLPLAKRIGEAGEMISRDLNYDEDYYLKIGTMWAIVNPPGAYNIAHIHPGCLWSGVYYVQTPKGCGKISFTDPRTANVMNKARLSKKVKAKKSTWTKVHFAPEAGTMLIFPSWLVHSVTPNEAEDSSLDVNRVIISFNLSQARR